jgi:uncharacterized membrane protein
MDSAFSWFILLLIVIALACVITREAFSEKREYEAQNDAFFRHYDGNRR